jgi:excisionase family DNA binding protein
MRSRPRDPGVQLLTPGEVAAMLYVHPRTVTRWAEAGKLSSVITPGGHRRFALSEVLRIMSAGVGTVASSTYEQVSGAVAHDSATAEAALSVTLTVADTAAAGALASDAAAAARCERQAAGREADTLVANQAARNVVGARIRADIAATRVRDAATLAAESALALAIPGDAQAELRASQTASTVEAAAVLVAAEAATLAEAVANDVATTAELIAAKRLNLEQAIEAEVEATAAALALRTVAAADASTTEVQGRVG